MSDGDRYDPIVMAFDAAEEHGANVDFAREEYATACAIIESLRLQRRGAVEAIGRIADIDPQAHSMTPALARLQNAVAIAMAARARLGGQSGHSGHTPEST